MGRSPHRRCRVAKLRRHLPLLAKMYFLWAITAAGVLENVVTRMHRHGALVELVGLNEASATLVDRHGQLTPRTRLNQTT
jgi:hypothetical protein